MFDKTFLNVERGGSSYSKVDIHEHRQSTSDDAKLLSDLEKEALDKITDVMYHTIEDTTFEFATYRYWANPMDGKGTGFMRFTLNGEKYEFKFDEEFDWDIGSPQQLIETFYRNLSNAITQQIFEHTDAQKELGERLQSVRIRSSMRISDGR